MIAARVSMVLSISLSELQNFRKIERSLIYDSTMRRDQPGGLSSGVFTCGVPVEAPLPLSAPLSDGEPR